MVVLIGEAPAMASATGGEPTRLTTPTPAATTNSVLSDVSCATDDRCVAVGSAQTHGYHRTGLVEVWNGTRWSVAAAGLFADLEPASLEGVSCSSASHCVAVGYGTTANATGSHGQVTRPAAAREVDGHWRASRPVARAGNVSVDGLSRLSCPDNSVCEAIGTAVEEGRHVTVIERLHFGRWTLSATSRLPGARFTTPGDIGCSGASSCLVTEGGLCLAFAHALHGSTLDEVSVTGALFPLPTPVASGGQAVDLAGLTCPALGRCFGLGKAGAHAAGRASTAGTTVAETYDGTAFTLAFTGIPLRLGGFACRPAFCMLVGSHARTAATARWEWPSTTVGAVNPAGRAGG